MTGPAENRGRCVVAERRGKRTNLPCGPRHSTGHPPGDARRPGVQFSRDVAARARVAAGAKILDVPDTPGTTKLQRLKENLGAADVTLTGEDLHAIDNAASQIPIQGARLPEADAEVVERDEKTGSSREGRLPAFPGVLGKRSRSLLRSPASRCDNPECPWWLNRPRPAALDTGDVGDIATGKPRQRPI